MSPLEKIENDYKQYAFHIEYFPDSLWCLHGYVDDGEIYINKNDPEEIQAKTALHEIIHIEVDLNNSLLNLNDYRTIRAEGFANRISERDVKRYM